MIKRLIPKPVWDLLYPPIRTKPRISKSLDSLSFVIAHNALGTYCVPKSSIHRPAAQRIMRGEVWEQATISFLVTHGERNGDIVHAGTYFGDLLPALSRAYRKVWAFEPNRENYRCAHITVLLNDLENVSLAHAGLGPHPGTARVKTRDNTGRSLGGLSYIADDGEPVQLVAIDAAVGDAHISVIQLDVERYEQAALNGALRTIRRCSPILVLETLPDTEWIAENLPGYSIAGKVDENTIIRPAD